MIQQKWLAIIKAMQHVSFQFK